MTERGRNLDQEKETGTDPDQETAAGIMEEIEIENIENQRDLTETDQDPKIVKEPKTKAAMMVTGEEDLTAEREKESQDPVLGADLGIGHQEPQKTNQLLQWSLLILQKKKLK